NPELSRLATSLENCLSFSVGAVPELNPDLAVSPVPAASINISMPDASALIKGVQSFAAPIADRLRKTGEIVGGAVKRADAQPLAAPLPSPPPARPTQMRASVLPAPSVASGRHRETNKLYMAVTAGGLVWLLAVVLFMWRPWDAGTGRATSETSSSAQAKKGDE